MMKLYSSPTSRFRCKVDGLESCHGQIVVVFGDTIVSVLVCIESIYVNYILDVFSKEGFCPVL